MTLADRSCQTCGRSNAPLLVTPIARRLVCVDQVACHATLTGRRPDGTPVPIEWPARPFPATVVQSPFTQAAIARDLPAKDLGR